MNVSSVVSASISTYSSSSADIASLQKQLAALQKKLQEESASQDDEKTNAAKIQLMQMQIQLIEAQIQQKLQAEAKKETGAVQPDASAKTQDQKMGDSETGSVASYSSSAVNIKA